MVQRLLLVGCSQRKRPNEEPLPAIERYDGPAFRVLRRYLRQTDISSVDIKILSAEYGLISSDYLLPYYDHYLTKEKAQTLNYQVIRKLKAVLERNSYSDFLLCLGQTYLEALKGYEEILPQDMSSSLANGGLGRKLSILHDWLYGQSSRLEQESVLAPGKPVYLKGVEINFSPDQVLDIARQAIAAENPKAFRCHSWYVKVDDQQVAPKWLVSKLTGLPVRRFITNDARRVLTQLGVGVRRV